MCGFNFYRSYLINYIEMAGVLFEDIFNVKDIDPEGKKFDRGRKLFLNFCRYYILGYVKIKSSFNFSLDLFAKKTLVLILICVFMSQL